MAILDNIINFGRSLLVKQEVATVAPNTAKKDKSAYIDPDLSNVGWKGYYNIMDSSGGATNDMLTDELLTTLNDCGRLLNNADPRNYINFSNLIFRIFPLYKKAIRLRTIFVGTISIENTSKNVNATKIDATIKYINEEIPIYDSGALYPKSYGINSLLNMNSEDCDIYGMSFVQLSYDNGGRANGIYIYKPSLFTFAYNGRGNKQLYYDNEVIDVNSVYIFCYQSIRGYDWGAPLMYGNKFMTDSVIKLINAQMQGLMRNMNPFDLTILSVDIEKLQEFPDLQEEVFEAMKKLKEDVKIATAKSQKGESAHVVANVSGLSSVNTSKGASTITFIDSKTFQTLIELFCAGLDVPYQLLMNVSGSMNTDQSSNGILLMEAWASEFSRPQLLPVYNKLIRNIFMSHGIPLGSNDVSITFKRNETMLTSLNAVTNNNTANPTQNEMPQ